MTMPFVFVAIKTNFFLLIFLQLLIVPIGEKRKCFAFRNGAKIWPQKWHEKEHLRPIAMKLGM